MTPPPADAATDQSPGRGAAERPYQSLYRRYRPQRFDEVRGQEHVTRALRNAVRDERITHAYLFSGPRGTGKTSTARILAKALNCTAPVEGEPCGMCDSCVSIVGGTSFDVHELDAASNNGVDAMRDLVARSALATPGRWKVYIVDEVHMLSTAASNALLKTLEEPPEHVVFVLATTDPQKVLPTIRSRTQHFEFHLLGEDVLEGLLEDVAADAGLELPEGGLGVALRRGRGSARDALSMLDQVAASGSAEDDTDSLAALVAGIADRDTAIVLAALDGALQSGRDPQQIAIDLVERLRAGFLALVAPGVPTSTSHGAPVAEEARALGTARCVRAMELVGASIVAMRDAPEPRITFEVALVRCAHPEADDTVESLLDRLVTLERRLERLEGAEDATPDARPRPRSQAPAPAAPAPPPEPATPGSRPVLGAYLRRESRSEQSPAPVSASPATPAPPPSPGSGDAPAISEGDTPARDELVAAWGDHILTRLRPKVRAYYQVGRFVGTDGRDAVFALPNAVHVSQAESMRSEVVAALGAHFGRAVGLRLVVDGTWSQAGAPLHEAPTQPVPHDEAPQPARSQEPVAVDDEAPTEIAPDVDSRPAAASAEPAEPVPAAPAPAVRSSRPRVATPAATPAAELDEAGDIDELEAIGEPYDLAPAPPDAGLTWAEDRLLQAFPGAEEV